MIRLATALAVCILPLGCSAGADDFSRATRIAQEIINDEAGSQMCQPAPASGKPRQALIQELSRITQTGLVDATGLTPVDYAVIADDVPAIERLTHMGYPLRTADGTLLHGAALHGSTQVLSFLLARGTDPNQTNAYGATPLMVAAAENRLDIAKILVASGASTQTRNNDGGTALHYALGCRNQLLVNVLLAAGAVRDDKARTLAGTSGLTLAPDER